MTRNSTGATNERGLVTVELALSTLAVLTLLAMVSWALCCLMVQLACIDSASAVARQAARGDRAGVAAAEAASPRGADVRVRRRAAVVEVDVTVVVAPPGGLLPAVTLSSRAEAVLEPGAAHQAGPRAGR